MNSPYSVNFPLFLRFHTKLSVPEPDQATQSGVGCTAGENDDAGSVSFVCTSVVNKQTNKRKRVEAQSTHTQKQSVIEVSGFRPAGLFHLVDAHPKS